MPLFEYRCDDCQHDFEVLVRAGEKPECPTCHSRKLEKLLSAPVARVAGLSMASACPPSDAPPCSPTCCRLPQ